MHCDLYKRLDKHGFSKERRWADSWLYSNDYIAI
jgi:hypothetical protein